MKHIKYIIILIIFSIAIYPFYREYQLGQHGLWKHCGGDYLFGDFMQLSSNYMKVYDNKVYYKSEPIAIVLDYQFTPVGDKIIITNIDGTGKAVYCGK